MIGGGAFNLLKAGRPGPGSAKQLKIGLAGFQKILSNFGRSAGCPIHGMVFNRALALIWG
jgi:hypothetical protein